jgi:predicted amidohydrolase
MRIALANLAFPTSPADSITSAQAAIRAAEAAQAEVICFPECYVPGYRAPGKNIPHPTSTSSAQRIKPSPTPHQPSR